MESLNFIANNKAQVERIVYNLFPQMHEFKFDEQGYENLVVLIDQKFVARFPKNDEIWRRGRLEHYLLGQLNTTLAQKVVKVNDNPPYTILNYLQGQMMSEEDFRALPEDRQTRLAQQIAEFAYYLHGNLDVDDFVQKYHELSIGYHEGASYGQYLQEVLGDKKMPTTEQDGIAKKYLAGWKAIRPSKKVVVHDDLHCQNLLFKNGELSGVIDFEAACVGSPEQDLRQLYRVSDAALQAAILKYNSLSGGQLDIEASRVWAVTQELAAYSRQLNAPEAPDFERAALHLKRWFPDVF